MDALKNVGNVHALPKHKLFPAGKWRTWLGGALPDLAP